jgi:uncharacterized protein YndB with AHSA1/START domain
MTESSAPSTGDSSTIGISITRTFDAPRELVYQAWTDPKQFAAWFGGAETEVPMETVSMDVREGGTWKLTMLVGSGAERVEMPWHGEFVELDPPSRLVMTLADSTSGDEREVCTVTFADVAGKTEMRFEQSGGHLDAANYAQAREGWLGFFEALAAGLPAA